MLEILLSSSVLILVLVLLRKLLRGRISARLQYALWALVLLRLLVPVTTFESKVSVAAVAQPISARVQHYSELHSQTVYIPMDMGENPGTGEPMEAVGRTYIEPLDLLRWTWYAGMAAVGLWFLLENRRMMRLLKKGRQYYGSYESVPVYLCEGIPSPCLFGLFRPAIYLTEQAAADDTQAGQILTHEYCHLCHGDLFWALLRSLCLVVWWFNPLVWWAAALSRRDGELACDESAIRRLGEDQRFDYGRTLLSLATVKLRPRDLLCGATTMTGGKNSLRERIEGIARTKKFSIGLAVLTLAIAAVTVGCTFAGSEDVLTYTQAAPVQTSDPVPMPTGDPVSASDNLIPLTELPEGYSYGDPSESSVDIWDTKKNCAVGGIQAYAAPDIQLIWDDFGYNTYREWLESIGVEDALDERLSHMGGSSPFGDFEMEYWNEVPLPEGDVSRYHTFFLAGSIVFDVWFDTALIDRSDCYPILETMVFPEVNTVILGEGYESYDVLLFDDDTPVNTDPVTFSEALLDPDTFSAYTLYAAYLTDFTNSSPTTWVTWLRFENEAEKQFSIDNYTPIRSATILSVEKINDKLFAFVTEAQTYPDVPADQFYNFLVLDPQEGSYVIRNVSQVPEELSEGLDPALYDPQRLAAEGEVILVAPDPELLAIQATLLDFINPPMVMIRSGDSYVSDGTAFADMTFEDLLYSTDSWQVNSDAPAETGGSDTYIVLFDGEGGQLVIDAGQDEIRFYPYTQYYASYSIPGVSGSYFYDSLLEWASGFPKADEERVPYYEQFLTMALTTDYQGRYTRLSEAGPSAAAYRDFYALFESLCDADCYYTMLLNRDIEKHDQLALERGYSIRPLSFEITAANQTQGITDDGVVDRWQREFTAHLEVTTADGLTGTGSISGYILTDRDDDFAPVTGFKLEGGTVLNADPADDVLPVE